MCTLGSTITLSSVRQKKIEGLFLRQQYKLRSTLKHKGSGEFSLGIDILRKVRARRKGCGDGNEEEEKSMRPHLLKIRV